MRGERGMGSGFRSRRELLRLGMGMVVGAVCAPRATWAARMPARSLTLYSIHTGEAISADYAVGGRYEHDALAAMSRLLRDHRTGDVHPIDPAVLDILHGVSSLLDTREPFHVVSGYRSPETNERKWRHGYGVARDSFHLYGRAVDAFLPGRDLGQLRRAAMTLDAGGVGYYPRSGFVHVDSGPVRVW